MKSTTLLFVWHNLTSSTRSSINNKLLQTPFIVGNMHIHWSPPFEGLSFLFQQQISERREAFKALLFPFHKSSRILQAFSKLLNQRISLLIAGASWILVSIWGELCFLSEAKHGIFFVLDFKLGNLALKRTHQVSSTPCGRCFFSLLTRFSFIPGVHISKEYLNKTNLCKNEKRDEKQSGIKWNEHLEQSKV